MNTIDVKNLTHYLSPSITEDSKKKAITKLTYEGEYGMIAAKHGIDALLKVKEYLLETEQYQFLSAVDKVIARYQK